MAKATSRPVPEAVPGDTARRLAAMEEQCDRIERKLDEYLRLRGFHADLEGKTVDRG